MASFTHFLVVDLEATCDQPSSFPREESEIIEIGAVLVEARTLSPVAEFDTFVRPILHPRLTAFCTELTSITQDQVDGAPGFPAALELLGAFLGERRGLLSSWGAYDLNQLRRDAARHQVPLPFGPGHWNVKEAFAAARREKPCGLGAALRRQGMDFEGTAHRGIDDARNIARLLPWIAPRAGPRR